jgi:drug/metabolite transporter (DMT)-like permease
MWLVGGRRFSRLYWLLSAILVTGFLIVGLPGFYTGFPILVESFIEYLF